jgi:hypothetical protein
MKTPLAIAVSLSLLTAAATVFAVPTEAPVHVISAHQKNLFVFKVNKNWKGATVEVQATNGEYVTRQKMYKRKMIINFCDVKSGTYKIKVTHGDHVEEFQYIKR